jgi:hypothetical protein
MVDTPVPGLFLMVDVAMVDLVFLIQNIAVEYPTDQLVVT